ncbi:hypothetical protein [Culicoidibacter larvae]|uniref:PH domain-containing protein n=1 Tax=Culicoidibacter larvae TaxID=2579976 RepID=A0A5R8QFL8_9FIRM|nr:hypothetical protein [Culicoidibacter larvae]TLG76536.1 hypothetical protein FEZ08_02665 [Culicoidibacter larvae]
MDNHLFAETAAKKIRGGLVILAVGAFFIGIGYFFLYDVVFPRYSQRLYPIIIAVIAAIILIGFCVYSMFFKPKKSIEVTRDRVIYRKGDTILGEYPFANYDFTSHITRYRTNGIVTNVERKLVISDGRSNKSINCPFLNKDEFSKMMSLIDNLDLQHFNQQVPTATANTEIQNESPEIGNAALYAGDDAVARTTLADDTATPTPAQPISATYQLKTDNIKTSIKTPLITGFIIMLVAELLVFFIFMDDLDTRRGLTTFMMMTLATVIFVGVIVAIIIFSSYSQKQRDLKHTPKLVNINQLSISFDQDTFLLSDIIAIEAIPVSYTTPVNKMRTVKLTTSRGIKTYCFGKRQDPKNYDDVIFSAHEYADFVYKLRQAFINRPEVFSHNLENF